MAEYTYPANDYDRVNNLLALLGSHWYNSYQGQVVLQGYLRARAREEAQAHLDLLETVASLSRFDVPIFHRDNWYLLTLSESSMNSRPLSYGDGATYGYQTDGTLYQYGLGVPSSQRLFEFELPADLSSCSTILNRITEPSRTMTRGIDFTIEAQADSDAKLLRLRANPFTDSRIPIREVYDGSEVVDREVDLWVFRGEFDWGHVYTHFGYVLSLRLASSEDFRAIVNAIMDAYVLGTAVQQVNAAVAAITGIPVVVEAQETVELVSRDSSHLVVVTSHTVYKYPLDCTPTVAVGDVVVAGDQLVDTVTFYEFNDGTVPDALGALTMALGFLPGGYVDGITFVNSDVPLDVSSDENGVTRIEFELGGFPTDVEAFWDSVHSDGISRGLTLARMLDVRGTDADTEPTAASLPSTINPLAFLLQNVLRFNAFVVRIKAGRTNSTMGLANLRLLRRIVPPWTAMIVLLDLTADPDTVTLVDTGTTTTPGYSEAVEEFSGAEPIPETIGLGFITEHAKLRRVDGVCQ